MSRSFQREEGRRRTRRAGRLGGRRGWAGPVPSGARVCSRGGTLSVQTLSTIQSSAIRAYWGPRCRPESEQTNTPSPPAPPAASLSPDPPSELLVTRFSLSLTAASAGTVPGSVSATVLAFLGAEATGGERRRFAGGAGPGAGGAGGAKRLPLAIMAAVERASSTATGQELFEPTWISSRRGELHPPTIPRRATTHSTVYQLSTAHLVAQARRTTRENSPIRVASEGELVAFVEAP